ncbi:hypothetical protein JD844_005355 [Phrynosoma platyrhinos]|uniref:Fibrinogen C-terminal domain-containing protein n=1 Tax=Phrynosoma platyrhinos TaxID=52577 RepID=A0ABQ7TMZ8_PHRPL|nr:hypothetical protein JD844_005355 [Phrynosoma platyrhinos]
MDSRALGLGPHNKGKDPAERLQHRVQRGSCTYTFLLPEAGDCDSSIAEYQVSNSLQRDAPPVAEAKWPVKRLQQLEDIMENNTQWLQKNQEHLSQKMSAKTKKILVERRSRVLTRCWQTAAQMWPGNASKRLNVVAESERPSEEGGPCSAASFTVLESSKGFYALYSLSSLLGVNASYEKLEGYIQENVRMEISDSHFSVVQNHTAAMLEIGTNLLNQTAEQTRKLTDVEMQQVLNQTSRLEIQVLENSLSTNKLEKQLLLQTQEISRLQERNSFLEKKVLALEGKREEELQGLRSEKLEMQKLLSKQVDFVGHLEQRLGMALLNNTALQKQQTSLAETVLCDMETSGGGWTVIQHRKDGSMDFQRTWKEYKQGFGSPSGEYWLGNDFIHLLTTQGSYSLRIKLQDWENNEAYALYDNFQVGPEEHNYRLYVRRYSGTAGRTSSLSPSGTEFSTKDVDNDRCACKCAQMAGGGWWFDACGPSNLNGIYYPPTPALIRYNGMKWHYWKGPSHSLKMASMMVRPVDFRED